MKQTLLAPCPFWAEKLAATHPDDLSPFERLALQNHIASCPTCAAIRAEYEAMGKLIGQLPAVEPRPGLPSRLLQLWQAQDDYAALAPTVPGNELAGSIPPSTSPSIPFSPHRRVRRVKVLVQTLAAVLVVAALLGSFLALFASHHTGPAGPPSPRSRMIRTVSSPSPGLGLNSLASVAVVSANDAWTVGFSSNSSDSSIRQTLIEHWDGKQWSVVKSPNPGSILNELSGVATVSPNDVWAVGDSFTNNNKGKVWQTLIEHWDGSQWGIVASPNPGSYESHLYSIKVVAANNIWAVGFFSNNSQGPSQGLVEHWDGRQWSVVTSPNSGLMGNLLIGLGVVAANDMWAVGSSGDQTLIEHWDGIQWSIVKSADLPRGSYSATLYSITAVTANDVWAVGYSFGFYGALSNSSALNVGRTLIEHWDGTRWSIVRSPNLPTLNDCGLSAVIAVAANDVWAVGPCLDREEVEKRLNNGNTQVGETYYTGSGLIEHWDGTAWNIVPAPNSELSKTPLNGLARVPSSTDIWVVGFSGDTLTTPKFTRIFLLH